MSALDATRSAIGRVFEIRGLRWLRRPPAVGEASVRRSWMRPAWIGAIGGLLLQTWMLTAGTWNLFRWDRSSDFYDAQAHSWLNGRWDMDPRVLGIEAFTRDGKGYMYFGPVPAILRLPVVVLTDGLEGRFSAVSMLLALVVTTLVVLSIGWRMRHLVLGDEPVRRGEQIGVGVLAFVIIGGSSLLYASSRQWVYHEAILWGVAFTLACMLFLLCWFYDRTPRLLALASLSATLAFLTRASVGSGAVAAMGGVFASLVIGWAAARLREPRPRLAGWLDRIDWLPPAPDSTNSSSWMARRPIAAAAAAVAVPLGLYATVSYIKFRTLFSVPFETQRFTVIDPDRQLMLAKNNGTLFNWNFVPSNLVQYWRPDALGLSHRWPFISYPERPMAIIGEPHYDLIDRSAGLPSTMPVLVVLGVIGVIAMFRSTRPVLRPLRLLVAAAVIGTISVLNIGYIANRYQSDFLPLLVVPALLGAPLVVHWCRNAAPAVRVATVTALASLAVFTVLANMALGYVFQRAYGPVTRSYLIEGYIERQLDVDDLFGDGRRNDVYQGDELPAGGRFGDVFVLGDCAAVYWSDGMLTNAVKKSNWNGVMRSGEAGGVSATVTFARPSKVVIEPLFTTNGGAGPATVYVAHGADGQMSLGYNGPDGVWLGASGPIEYGTAVEVFGFFDPVAQILEFYVDDRLLLAIEYTGGTEVTAGINTHGLDIQPEFSGTIQLHPIDTSICDRLVPSARPWPSDR